MGILITGGRIWECSPDSNLYDNRYVGLLISKYTVLIMVLGTQ